MATIAGVRPRDEALIDRLLQKRRQSVDASASAAALHQLEALVADFKSLRDVAAEEARVVVLSKHKDVKAAVAKERRADETEQLMLDEFFEMEQRLRNPDLRSESLTRLRGRLAQWARLAANPAASPERAQARRLLSTAGAGVSSRTDDTAYLELLNQYRRVNVP